MRTYTHGIIGYLLYVNSSARQKFLVIAGAMIPDLFLIIGFIFHFLGDSFIVNFLHNLFHHSFLHTFTELMHSFTIVFPFLLFSGLFFRTLFPFFIGMFSHVFVDLLTHQNWMYNYFFPLNIKPVFGIVSYTTVWFSVVEHLAVFVFLFWFFKKG